MASNVVKIEVNIPQVLTLDCQIRSPPHLALGMSWCLIFEPNEAPDMKYLSVNTECRAEYDSHDWSCMADINIRLHSTTGPSHYWRHRKCTFNTVSKNRGNPFFIPINNLQMPELGFVSNGSITIEAIFVVTNVRNVRNFTCFNTQDDLTDITLVCNGRKLHVNKEFLSIYSPVFRAMFSGNFEEKNAKEITLDDEFEEFLELMRNIYPCHKEVDKKNVEYLMELADKYDMKNVIDECETFLIIDEVFPKIRKLILAEQYSLVELKNRVVQSFISSEIQLLQTTEEYGFLTDVTKTELMEKFARFA